MAKNANVTKTKTSKLTVSKKATGKVGSMKPPKKAIPSAKYGGSKKKSY